VCVRPTDADLQTAAFVERKHRLGGTPEALRYPVCLQGARACPSPKFVRVRKPRGLDRDLRRKNVFDEELVLPPVSRNSSYPAIPPYVFGRPSPIPAIRSTKNTCNGMGPLRRSMPVRSIENLRGNVPAGVRFSSSPVSAYGHRAIGFNYFSRCKPHAKSSSS